MELLLIGWVLGLVTAAAYYEFFMKPVIDDVLNELLSIRYNLNKSTNKSENV